jgi:hypothetical protein
LPKATSKDKQFFKIWADEAENAYKSLTKDIDLAIRSARATGMSNEAIAQSLTRDLENRSGAFASYAGGVNSAGNDLFHLTAQGASNDGVRDAADLFVWTLDPTADHCGDCLANAEAGEKTFEAWESQGLPGMGSTECGEYCKCSLDPSGEKA